MKKILLASVAIIWLVAPAYAVTATFCGPTSEAGGACEFGVEQKVFLNEAHDVTSGSGNIGSQTGPIFLFSTDTGAVDINVDTGGGFANITTANADHATFKSFNGIDIKIPGFTFTDLVFDVQLAGPGGDTPETFTISPFSGAHVSDGIGTESDIQDDKDTEFSVLAHNGVFDEVNIQAGPLGFDEIKHIEISGLAAVPEPSTWVLFGVGFGLLGLFGRKTLRQPRSALL